MTPRKTVRIAFASLLLLAASFAAPAASAQTPPASPSKEGNSTGVALQQRGLRGPGAELERRIKAAAPRTMGGNGLAGAMGGARVNVTEDAPREILLSIPQLTDGQVPLAFFIASNPSDAVTEYRIWSRSAGNMVVLVTLEGKRQEVQITWSSVVLMTPWNITPETAPFEPYRAATPCVQSTSERIVKLADTLWPASGRPDEFAANIRGHVERMARKSDPKSLDALGILASGDNTICTANSNVAAALMRAKGIACRSLAVIPLVSRQYEMHRVSEFADGDRWARFDPSSLHRDIPAKPWQNIVMSKSTIDDERRSMRPRNGVMLGCPYGQSIELPLSGVVLTGRDFFWTIGKPLAEFEATEESARLAAEAWKRFLETGALTQGQIDARAATTAAEFSELLKAE